MTNQDSEKTLVQKAIRHDPDAFTELYWRNVDRVYRHVFYGVRNQNAAEDITQETFLRAWKAFIKYQERGNTLAAWLIAIAENVTSDYYKASKRTVPLLDENGIEKHTPNLKTNIDSSNDRNDIHEAISRLTEEKQRVVIMRYIEGFSFAEISQALKKSEGAVRIILHRALNDLRNILRI